MINNQFSRGRAKSYVILQVIFYEIDAKYFFHSNQNVTTDCHQFTYANFRPKSTYGRGWLAISSAEKKANPSQFYR